MGFYSERCRLFVPGNLTTLIAYHVVVPFHHACRPCVSGGSVVRDGGLFADISAQMAVSDKVFNLVLQVAAFLSVMYVFPVKVAVSSFVTPLGV
ncbi:hypothetical protein B296_00054792 [Ensete ventricosum]|uniref:Uncharacterized protein n=1 Tax=Ensete ventricosum TaxID=4639 RepID=A0A426WX43_ENSVE|nr:hypothetical protein B296_00054792 [Ensete ventricosum]